MGRGLAGSKGAQMGATFFLTPAPVLAEHVAGGKGCNPELPGSGVSITLFGGLPAKDDFFFPMKQLPVCCKPPTRPGGGRSVQGSLEVSHGGLVLG